MPIDLVEADPRIVVRDSTGTRLPYSRGIMATSLLASGVPTEEAYRLASLIQARLLHHDRHDVAAADLVEIALLAIDEHATHEGVSQRWLTWRRAKRSGRPIVIALGGAPGVGKSTLAARLAVRLDIPRVVATDTVRDVLRLVVPATVHPELHRSAFELLDPDEYSGFTGFDRHCGAVGHAAIEVAGQMATEHRSLILEGVHLDPGEVTRRLADHAASPIVIERLVTVTRFDQHLHHIDETATTGPLPTGRPRRNRIDDIRSIQQYLRTRSGRADTAEIDAHVDADVTQSIVDEIAAHPFIQSHI